MNIIDVPNLKEIERYFSETKLNIFVICVKKKKCKENWAIFRNKYLKKC